MLTIRVQDGPRELRAAVLAMKRADAEVRGDVSARLRAEMSPEWASMLAQHLTGLPQEKILLKGARIAAGNPPVLYAANSKRPVGRGGGMIPTEVWHAWEYGASTHKPRTYERRNRKSPGTHKVRRDTHAGLPARRENGRVIGPALAVFLPRVAAFWTQSVVKAFMDAAEKR